ncbi:MAG TPA: cation-translocating P-type ATPase C-terminal domain-containing protein, partial [Anaerolineales bacterium]|nr:cation-translocating P-type ATPase C-terminal domain-containing protein [Anaerolineales bacterium]
FSSNIPEIMPFIVKANFPLMPLALNVRQILAIDLGTDMFPALALGMEKPEPDVMKRRPRPRTQPLLDRGLLWRAFWLGMIETTLCFAGFLSVFIFSGHAHRIGIAFLAPLASLVNFRLNIPFEQAMLLATTVYHAGVVTSQVGNVLACRSDRARSSSIGWLSNKYLWVSILLEIAGILALIYIPSLAKVFNHIALPAWMWIGLGMNALVLYSIEWIRKTIVRKIISIRHEKSSSLSMQEVSQ